MAVSEGTKGAAAERILDAAERLVQLRGFNGFSYADVAAELGVTKPSLHYHFPSKAALGAALVDRYGERFARRLAEIDDRVADAPSRLAAYADLYGAVLDGQRMCLCGMLAAEFQTLPEEMRRSVLAFFDRNEAWLGRVLREGRRSGTLAFSGSPRDLARALVSALEGALLTARPYGDAGRYRRTAARLIATLAAPVGRATADVRVRRH